MTPLFMEIGHEPNSPGSISAEDYTAGSEREGDGQQVGHTGGKRREKNRDAARKSRKKQTERADVLHEELQRLERSNSALHKEIAALKKDLLLYTTALERHKPHCCLRESASKSSSPNGHSVSPSVSCRSGPSPAGVASQTANSTLLPASSFSTSLNRSLGVETVDSVENTHLSPSTSTAPTLLPSSGSSADLFVTSSSDPATVSCSLSLSMLPAPHSLFVDEPAIASRPTNVTSVSTSLVSTPVPPSAFSVAAHPQSVQDSIHKTSSVSESCFSDTLDAFLTKQTSFILAPTDVRPPYSHVAHGCNAFTNPYNNNPNNSNPLSSFLPSTLHDSALQSFSVPPQTNFPAFPLKPNSCQQTTSNPASLLSLLTVPSPLNVPQTTSNSFTQSPPSLPLLLDTSKDLSLSELLEVNDWILSGTSNV